VGGGAREVLNIASQLENKEPFGREAGGVSPKLQRIATGGEGLGEAL
jgi:hypothetical protein